MTNVCLVWFKESATKEQIGEYLNGVIENGATIKHAYESLGGVALEMEGICSTASFLEHDIVSSIEPDQPMTTFAKFRRDFY
ncbi:hypothetical protein RSOLAG1IB_07843 [Rhizoctonia solani AG-1 IB]|uniref:Inhibitor I9 domain-containing protein n=1 Tax=Thanatephorus cucumeris (strain AG1-IB / isolate 7/3/14) TaxID=1108050 RepID=A0A0B7FHT2_THACB|nr:hypothetical protein RSOLAG1IB_07843 [Rhizoctonia solani AG-1 IB]